VPPSLAHGRYVITGFLGEGARKRVYLAHDERLDRDVAVALIPSVGSDPAARERIAAEARAMARLGSHPNIVTVHDFGEEGDAAYIVSEYMAQGSVAEVLAAAGGKGLEIERAARLARQVAAALAHAHRAGIVHRDVKPHNVFLNADGHARLGDFGVALALDRPRLSGEGMVGTVDYMPPEQALNRPVDARSDLYSLGAMLYELVCGRPPFRGEDVVAVVSQHINSPPVAPSWHRPEVPALLEELILALLEKAPDDRPDSAEQVGTVLESIELAPARAAEEELNPIGRLSQGEFVGRGDELERLRELMDAALDGRGALALVSGEPGIGKTRLLEELGAYAALRGARVGWGRCYEGDGAPAYWPWAQLVRTYLNARPVEASLAAMGAGARDIARVVPEVAEATGTPAPTNGMDSPEQTRFRFFEAMGRFLTNAATGDKPLLLILDDLHWADTASLLLLGFLAREARSAPVLIVGTYRDAEVDQRAIGELDAEARLALTGLREDDVARFIEVRSGAAADPRLVEAAYARTDGNPFFLGEVMRLLVSEGALDPERALGVPQGVRDVIGRRLDRLSEATRASLAVAAVIGRDFGLDVLQRASGQSADDVLDALDEAVDAQVVLTGTAARFRFAHALVRETIYDDIGSVKRLRLHLKVGEALEEIHAAHVAELAHHWFEALPVAGADKAVDYSIAAARRSHAQLAFEESALHYDRACRALALAGREDEPQRIELLLARGDAQTHAGAFEASRESFREAAELAGAQGMADLEARAALGFAQWSVLGSNDPAVALLEAALDALPRDDSALRA